MIDFRKTVWLMLPAALLIAGCSEDAAPVQEESEAEAEASGEVLDGTISDAMLPVDQVRSQAPMADPEPEEDADGTSSASSSAGTPAETSEPAVEPVPDIEVAEPVSEEGETAE